MVCSILVVCVGNICRSPTGERLLRDRLPGLEISSAGIAALVGQPADALAAEVAEQHGVSLDGHVARQFMVELGSGAELILAMEPGHKREIARLAPHLAGRIMLFDQWTGAAGIDDPYRQPRSQYEAVFRRLAEAADAWAERLLPKDKA